MKPPTQLKGVRFLFTDIDDTMTDRGQLGKAAYGALWDLSESGVQVIPVTGRPAGWCEMIARFWPVAGVVGENGGFYFRYYKGKMHRHFIVPETQRIENRRKLDEVIAPEILSSVPGCAIASDQFCRLLDLAIDYCEDVKPLSKNEVRKIVSLFEKHGAQAKVSSIHVNGWFGDYNKLSTCRIFLKQEFNVDADKKNRSCAFVGDSPNDEPMFGFFKNSFAVANIKKFIGEIKAKPAFIASKPGGLGFAQVCKRLSR